MNRTLSPPPNLNLASLAVCIDTTYAAPPGVHVAMWRFIAVQSGGSTCSAAMPGAVTIGYGTMRPDRVRQVFSITGQLMAQFDPAGNELRYTYDLLGRLATVYEPASCPNPATSTCRALRLSYPTNQVQVIDPAGRTVVYQLTSDGLVSRLTSVTVTDGAGAVIETWGYDYDSPVASCGAAGRLCKLTPPSGKATAFSYQVAGGKARVAALQERHSSTDPNTPTLGELTTTFEYTGDPVSTSTTVTRADRAQRHSGIDTFGRVADLAEGTPAQLTAGQVSRRTGFGWDSTVAACRPVDPKVDHNLCRLTSYTGTVTATGAPAGWSAAADAVTEWAYTPEGMPLFERRLNDDGDGPIVTTYGYETTATMPDGATSEAPDTITGAATHTSAGRAAGALFAVTDRVALRSPRANTTSWTIDRDPSKKVGTVGTATCGSGNSGLVCREDRPLGATTTYTYDGFGQRITMRTPNSQPTGASYLYDYYPDADLDASNQVSMGGWLRSVTDPAGKFVVFDYDRAGNVVRAWDRDATRTYPTPQDVLNAAPSTAIETRYRTGTFAAAVANPWRWTMTEIDQLGNITTHIRDAHGNPTAMRAPRGNAAGNGTFDVVQTFSARDQLASKKLPEHSQVWQYRYDEAANPTAAVDPNGNVTVTVHDPANRATGTRFTRGPWSEITPLLSSRCTQSSGADAPIPAGRIMCSTATAYDGADRAFASTDPDGATTWIGFDQAGRAGETWAPRTPAVWLHSRTNFDLDSNPVVVCAPRQADEAPGSVCEPGAKWSTTTTFDALNRVSEVTTFRQQTDEATGARSATLYDTLRWAYGYDTNGNRTSTEDPRGNITTVIYDLLDRRDTQSEPRSPGVIFVTDWDHSPAGDLTAMVQGAGSADEAITAYSYDPAHRLVDTIVGATARDAATVGVVSSPFDLVVQNQRTRNRYDPDGNLVGVYRPTAFASSTADPDERYLTRIDHDRNRRPIARWETFWDDSVAAVALPGAGEDGDDCPTPSTDHQPAPVAGVDAYPVSVGLCVTRVSYDPAGRLVTVRNPSGGRIITSGAGGPDNADDPASTGIYRASNRYREYRYSDDDLIAEVIDPNPSPTPTDARAEAGLPAGRVRSETNRFDASGRPVQGIDRADYQSTRALTGDGLALVVESGPLGGAVDAQATSVFNHAGQPTQTTTMVDATTSNVASTVYNSDGSTYTSTTGGLTTRYRLDPAANPTQVWSPAAVAADATNPAGLPTKKTFTADNLLETSSDPVAANASAWRTTTFGYDALDRTTTSETLEVDGAGVPVAGNVAGDTRGWVFNDNGSVRSETGRNHAQGGAVEQTDHFYYADQTPFLTYNLGTGAQSWFTYWLNGLTRNSHTTGVTANATNRYLQQRWTGDGLELVRSGYTDANRTLNEAFQYYVRDDARALDAMYSVGWGQGFTPWTVTQDNLGRPTQMVDQQGHTTTYGYNPDSTLSEQTLHQAGTGSAQLAKWEYAYDGRNRVIEQRHAGASAPGATSNTNTFGYGYDPAGRVTTWNDGTSAHTFSYDANSNRTRFDTTATSYRPDNTISAAGPDAFTYDQFGRLTNDSCTTNTYDGYDRLLAADACGTKPDGTYTYDPLGRQLTRTIGTDPTIGLNHVAGGTSLWSEIPTTGTAGLARYSQTPDGQPVAVSGPADTIHMLHPDGNGSTGTTTTPTGVACTLRYNPWGDPVGATAASSCNTGTTPATTLYQQARRDPATGDYQFGTRTYNPTTGTWHTPDTGEATGTPSHLSIGTDPLTANRYSYVNGDPVNYADPTGHRACVDANCNVTARPGTNEVDREAATGLRRYYDKKARQRQAVDTYIGHQGRRAEPDLADLYTSRLAQEGAAGELLDMLNGIFEDLLEHPVTEISGASDLYRCIGLDAAACGWTTSIFLPISKLKSISRFGDEATTAIRETPQAIRPVGSALESVDDVLTNPQMLAGRTPAEVQAIVGRTPGWQVETLGRGSHQGQGWVLREYTSKGDPTGRMLRWHPGGGHHGTDPYWRVTDYNTRSGEIR